MKFYLSIALKIGLAFGVIIVFVIFNAVLTNYTLKQSKEVNQNINHIYTPSVKALDQLWRYIDESRILTKSWSIEQSPNTSNKLRLMQMHEVDFPTVFAEIDDLRKEWGTTEMIKYDSITIVLKQQMLAKEKYVMEKLNSMDSYGDALLMFTEIEPLVDDGGELNQMSDTLISKVKGLVKIQNTNIEVAQKDMEESFDSLSKIIGIMAAVLTILTFVMAFLTINSLVRPINYIKAVLLNMAKGILPNDKIKEGKDEIGQMSYALNNMVGGLKNISNFAIEIGRGNLESSFEPLSEEDALGKSLIDMREELKTANEEEAKRKVEDQQRNWATQGVAKFGEILRLNNDDIKVLSFNIISELVKYLNANQGGIFLINDNDKNNMFLELTACYAYDRQKFQEKEIPFGVGLVGRCVLERETIFITDVPQNYINITSGLGEDSPRSIVIVPLAVNDEIYGVVEIASFKVFEPYQIEFLEKIGETIAATISSVKINLQTSELLAQSQEQGEEMASQEEEMRQNMEELRATQEASSRREQELSIEVEKLKSLLGQNNIPY